MTNQAQPQPSGDGLVRHVCFSGSPQCSACIECAECREVKAAVVYPQVLTMLGLDAQAAIGPFLECLAQATGRLHYLMENDPNFRDTYQVQVFRMRPPGAPAPAQPPAAAAPPPPPPAAAAPNAPPPPNGPPLPFVPPIEEPEAQATAAAPAPPEQFPPVPIARVVHPPPSETVRERLKPPPMVRPMSVEEIAAGGRVLDDGRPTE